MRAVIYARYSSDNQREESIDGQLRECKKFAEYNGITIIGEYIDRAFSAKTDNRPEFQRMIKDSYKSVFDTVIVWKLDRFARNRYDSARYKALLKKNGVRVISATEKISEEQILHALYHYKNLDISTKEGKQRLIDGFVNSIFLYDDRYVITFNYKNKSKTVTFEEIESSSLTSKASPRIAHTLSVCVFSCFPYEKRT